MGIPLTTERSLAVDSKYIKLGSPVFIDTSVSVGENRKIPYSRLMIAQDKGSAIKGIARADIFFGIGELAEFRAGRQKFYGDIYVLKQKP